MCSIDADAKIPKLSDKYPGIDELEHVDRSNPRNTLMRNPITDEIKPLVEWVRIIREIKRYV